MLLRILLLLALLVAAPANAQSPVVTQPYPTTTHNDSGTIATTGTFQSIWAASTNTRGRAGCTVQNVSATTQYVFFGPIASATTATSVTLAAGQPVSCVNGGIVLQDQVSITGTTGAKFYAGQQ